MVHGSLSPTAVQDDLGDTGVAFGGAGETGGAGVPDNAEDNVVDYDDTRLSLNKLSVDSSVDNFELDGDEANQVGTESLGKRPCISGNLEDMKSFA